MPSIHPVLSLYLEVGGRSSTGREFRTKCLLAIWHTDVHLQAATRQCPPKVPVTVTVGTAWRLLAGSMG